MIVLKTNNRDIESINLIVIDKDKTIATGSYNIRSNWAHIYVEDKYSNIYDESEIIEKIENRVLEIQM